MSEETICVDVISSVLNGARFLPDFLESLQRQTHAEWRLWIRNNGSTDDSAAIVAAAAQSDSRINLIAGSGAPLSVTQTFAAVIDRLPGDSTYVMCGDADDVWLPDKIVRMLRFMRESEQRDSGIAPLLIHSDLTVVDERLAVIAPSYWRYRGVNPEPATLRRLVVSNPVTSSAIMFNAPLRRALSGGIPGEALFQDWWFALVGVAIGRVVPMPETTVLYRQHDANAIGAAAVGFGGSLVGDIIGGFNRSARFRVDLVRTARQAGALVARYGPRLSIDDRAFLTGYASLPSQGFYRRKLGLLRYRVLPEYGVARTLGVLLRG